MPADTLRRRARGATQRSDSDAVSSGLRLRPVTGTSSGFALPTPMTSPWLAATTQMALVTSLSHLSWGHPSTSLAARMNDRGEVVSASVRIALRTSASLASESRAVIEVRLFPLI